MERERKRKGERGREEERESVWKRERDGKQGRMRK